MGPGDVQVLCVGPAQFDTAQPVSGAVACFEARGNKFRLSGWASGAHLDFRGNRIVGLKVASPIRSPSRGGVFAVYVLQREDFDQLARGAYNGA